MRILTPGHRYIADNFENPVNGQTIQFIEKIPAFNMDGSLSDSLVTVNDGTTNEELLAVLIDRLGFLQAKFPCKENACAITKLQEGLHWLNARTANRKTRGVEGMHKP